MAPYGPILRENDATASGKPLGYLPVPETAKKRSKNRFRDFGKNPGISVIFPIPGLFPRTGSNRFKPADRAVRYGSRVWDGFRYSHSGATLSNLLEVRRFDLEPPPLAPE